MFHLVLLSTLAVLVGAAAPKVRPIVPSLDGRIVGGKDTTIDKHPHQVSLQYFSRHICGASLISANRALTSAYCTDGASAKYLSVRAGSSQHNSEGQLVGVSSYSQHAKYNSRTLDYDIAVLVLSQSLVVDGSNPNMNVVQLHAADEEVVVGALCTVTGWGSLASGGAQPTTLQEVQIPNVSQDDCKKAYGFNAITDRMLCYGDKDGKKDTCQGDAGGPMVCPSDEGLVQVGVVSWGKGCADKTYPGVYARIGNKELNAHIQSFLT